jgi:hypothetical protein
MDAPEDPTLLLDSAPRLSRSATPQMNSNALSKHDELVAAHEMSAESSIHDAKDDGEGRAVPQCCCGRPECPFLAHSCQLLEGLEKDVQTAARMGQVRWSRSAASAIPLHWLDVWPTQKSGACRTLHCLVPAWACALDAI